MYSGYNATVENVQITNKILLIYSTLVILNFALNIDIQIDVNDVS